MENLPIGKAFTLIEPGPVVLVTTNDGRKDNVMAISWTMVLDFTAKFAIRCVRGRRGAILRRLGCDNADRSRPIGNGGGRPAVEACREAHG
jgi:hypothetical protein